MHDTRPVHDAIPSVVGRPARRLVIVVRADPVICGHSGEARNLAEAALLRGFDDVRIVTWPLETLGALPLKPLVLSAMSMLAQSNLSLHPTANFIFWR